MTTIQTAIQIGTAKRNLHHSMKTTLIASTAPAAEHAAALKSDIGASPKNCIAQRGAKENQRRTAKCCACHAKSDVSNSDKQQLLRHGAAQLQTANASDCNAQRHGDEKARSASVEHPDQTPHKRDPPLDPELSNGNSSLRIREKNQGLPEPRVDSFREPVLL